MEADEHDTLETTAARGARTNEISEMVDDDVVGAANDRNVEGSAAAAERCRRAALILAGRRVVWEDLNVVPENDIRQRLGVDGRKDVRGGQDPWLSLYGQD